TIWAYPYIYANLAFSYSGDASLLPLPSHLLAEPLVNAHAEFLDLPYWTTDFVGTGPYRLTEWSPGDHAFFVANDGFVLGRPKIDDVEVRFIADTTALVAAMLAGAVDVAIGRGLSLDQARAISAQDP